MHERLQGVGLPERMTKRAKQIAKVAEKVAHAGDHFCTPKVVDDCLFDFFNGPVGLDPCSNSRSIIRSKKRYTAGGLHLPWERTNFENNPYSKMLRWVQKGSRELVLGGAQELVTLWPVATSTKWWKQATGCEPIDPEVEGGKEIWSPNPTLIFAKRIAFIGLSGKPEDGARHDPVFFYYGPEKRHRAFLRAFNSLINWSTRGR